jgi:hypothetical protein
MTPIKEMIYESAAKTIGLLKESTSDTIRRMCIVKLNLLGFTKNDIEAVIKHIIE